MASLKNSELTGLSQADVRRLREEGKVNTLPPRSGRTTAQIIKANVFTRVNALLGVLFALVLTTGSWINGAFGLLIIANSIIGIVQELRAKHTLDSLAVVGEARPRVLREGEEHQIAQDEIVLGDVILIGPGEQIVVDGRVVSASHLEVDESLLTGESDPIAKETGATVMSGSFVASGTGAYEATGIGSESYAAQLTEEASRFSLVDSELQNGINHILRVITWILVPLGILTVWGQIRLGAAEYSAVVLKVAGALVPMIPEGLILITSTAFALGVIRLGRRGVLVNELPAIEGLARVDVVCADKTGTLTEGTMEATAFIPFGDRGVMLEALRQLSAADDAPNSTMQAIEIGLAQVGYAREPEGVLAVRHASLLDPALLDTQALAGDVSAPAQRSTSTPTETSAATEASTFTGDAERVAFIPMPAWHVQATQPFSSAKKWSGGSFAEGTWVLGAPDVLLEVGSLADERARELGGRGLRVLALCKAPSLEAVTPAQLQVAGLIVLEQKVRPDAEETIRYFERQGVDVKVISGDNAESVAAVTRRLGVSEDAPVDARTITEAEFADVVNSHHVFGRVTPAQKRAMVAALKSRGRTVAMTGDGVNDVLALKDADLGVAMGSGTSATRSVAKIVLLNDAFSTLPHVVAEGRRVLGNIERVANLFLTKTIYSSLLAILVLFFAVPYPFQPIHVTITGWFTIGIPAFILSLPPNNQRARGGFVARVLRFGIPAGLVVSIASFITYMLGRLQIGGPGTGWLGWLGGSTIELSEAAQTQISTAALLALIISSTWVLVVVARPYTWWKFLVIGLPLLGYGLIFTLPLTQQIFLLDSSNLPLMIQGALCGLIGAGVIEALWWVGNAAAGERPQLFASAR